MIRSICSHLRLKLHDGLQSATKRLYGQSAQTEIRRSTMEDAPTVLELYKKFATSYPDGLTQQNYELTLPFVQSILRQTCQHGLGLVVFDNNPLIEFLKAYTSEFRRQAHVFDYLYNNDGSYCESQWLQRSTIDGISK